jgi:hypothetical protein
VQEAKLGRCISELARGEYDERESIGVDARGSEAYEDITNCDVGGGKDQGSFYCSYSEACEVIITYV